jgi:hypothetical protein
MPAIHAGMTKSVFSSSVGERKIMNHSFEIKTEAIRQARALLLESAAR